MASALRKELDRRTLVMHDVFKSKTMVVQQKLAKLRERLTSRIELVEDTNGPEQEVTPTLHLYIASTLPS